MVIEDKFELGDATCDTEEDYRTEESAKGEIFRIAIHRFNHVQIAVHHENGDGKFDGQLVATILAPSSRTSRSAGLASREPFLERGLAFTGWFAGKEALDADILIEFAPMNPVPSADQSPVVTFCWCCVN